MSKLLSSCICLLAIVAIAGNAVSQERVIKKKVKAPQDAGVIVIEVDTKTGEVRTRPVDPKGGKVLHVIGDLALQKGENKLIADKIQFESKDGKKVIVKQIQDSDKVHGEKAHGEKVHGVWIQDVKGGDKPHAIWVQDSKDGKKRQDVWIQKVKDQVKKSDQKSDGGNVWVEKSDDGKIRVIRKNVDIKKDHSAHEQHDGHDQDGHHHHGDHDEDVRIEKSKDGKRIMIRKVIDGEKHGEKHGEHNAIVLHRKSDHGGRFEVIRLDGEGKHQVHDHDVIIRKKSKTQEQSSPSDHSAHESNHGLPADVIKMLKQHGVELGGENVDIRVENVEGGRRIQIRKGDGDKIKKEFRIRKQAGGDKGSAHLAIVDDKALDESIRKAFSKLPKGVDGKNVQVIVKKGDSKSTPHFHAKDLGDGIHGVMVIDGSRRFINGGIPHEGHGKANEMDIDILVEQEDGKKQEKRRQVIIQGDKAFGHKTEVKPNVMHFRVKQDQDGKKDKSENRFEYRIAPEMRQGTYRFVPKAENKDGVNSFRFELKRDGDAPKSDKVKPRIVDLKVDPAKVKAGEFRFAPRVEKLDKIEWKMPKQPIAPKKPVAPKFEFKRRGSDASDSKLAKKVDDIDDRLKSLEKKIEKLIKKLDK